MNKPNTSEIILTIVVGLLVLFLIFKAKWLMIAALVIGLIGVFIKPLADLISKGWMKFAEGLGYVNSRILLSLIFFLFLFPLAVVYRIFSEDNLLLKKEERDSIYADRSHSYTKTDFEKMF